MGLGRDLEELGGLVYAGILVTRMRPRTEARGADLAARCSRERDSSNGSDRYPNGDLRLLVEVEASALSSVLMEAITTLAASQSSPRARSRNASCPSS